jgi:hypothetical protein
VRLAGNWPSFASTKGVVFAIASCCSVQASDPRTHREVTTKSIFLWSLPLAIALQVLVLIGAGLVEAPGEGIICTASLHGARAEPCSFWQLLAESVMATFWLNLFTVGGATLAAYLVSVIGLTLSVEGWSLVQGARRMRQGVSRRAGGGVPIDAQGTGDPASHERGRSLPQGNPRQAQDRAVDAGDDRCG